MALDQKDLEQVTGALSSKFDEMKQKNDKELESVKSELAGEARKLAEEVKGLQNLKDEIDESLKQKNRIGNNSGDADEHKEAFIGFMKSGNEQGLAELQTKALSIGVDGDGGFAVPESLDTQIIATLTDANVMRQACRVIQVGSAEYKKLVNTHGVASGWVGE
jgi:HK97 family phage major capsid protein